ncbi:exopolysaccharide transporter [Caballeronia cordobensis]|uniref:Putative tyrosine-protein kinase EpsB n=1 Tax=Caballeronia cordobensis TaxID=1353886 RepID=A0A158JPS1_CABCO|nr:polysaccharide biosynthesis tyrosine autokinase [Caballeronia cordobensis]SAL70431.1 exopolysaccharide transporter [Caballeronia cordobensis]
MSHPDRHSSVEAAELDVIGVIDTLFKNAWRIVLIATVVALAGTAWAFFWPPKYQADVLIQIEDSADGGTTANLLNEVSTLFDVKSSAAAEAQIIISRLVVARAVEKLRLHIDVTPKRFPVIGDFVSRVYDGPLSPGLFGFGGFAWGQERADVLRFDVPKKLQDEPFTLSADAGGRFTLTSSYLDQPVRGMVGSEDKVDTPYGPLVINVARIDALPGTRFSVIRHSFNDTVAMLQERLDVQEKVKQSGVIVATLLGRDAERTSQTLREIAEQYVRQNVERKYADAAQSLAFLSAQLPDLKQKLEEAQARYTQLRNEKGVIDLPAETASGLQQQAEAKAQLIVLQQKRAELVTRYTPMHPGVAAIDEQISLLRRQIAEFDTALGRLPNVEQDAARLMLDVKVNTDLYSATLNNAQQLQLVKAGKVGSVRLIDAPVIQEDPAWPKRPLAIVAAILGGLLLGIAYAFAREFLAGAVHTADEIERDAGMQVLATVPLSAAQPAVSKAAVRTHGGVAHLLAIDAPHDTAIEGLRSLRTALRMSMADAPGKVVLLTGAAPGVGKSFVAANLGAVLAATGQRVLLIEGDLRRPSLNPCFGVDRAPGWSDLINGTAELDRAVHRSGPPGLDFIAAGSRVPNPAELLASTRAASLLDSVRVAYDYVVIDTPPILAVEDAASFAAHAHTVLLVARAGETRIGELIETEKRLRLGGAKPAGVILNGLSPRSVRASYGSKGYRSYDYGLSDSTGVSNSRSWWKRK